MRTRWTDRLLLVFTLAVHAFLYLPSLVLALLSFNRSTTITLPWQGFTGDWYRRMAENPDLLETSFNSLTVAAVATLLAVVVAFTAVLSLRTDLRLRRTGVSFILIPVATPSIIMGISVAILAGQAGLPPSLFGTVLLTHVLFLLPYAFMIIWSQVQSMDLRVEEAALDLGATPPQTFWRVTLPLLTPSVLSAALFGFLLSFDEFIRTFFVSGPQRTLPMFLWGLLFDVVTPEIAALATVLTALGVILTVVSYLLHSRYVHQPTPHTEA